MLSNNLKKSYYVKTDSEGNNNEYFLEVGKAYTIVLHANIYTILIDTGFKNRGKELVEILSNQGIDTIDCIIPTNFDKDHAGGASKVIKVVSDGKRLTIEQ